MPQPIRDTRNRTGDFVVWLSIAAAVICVVSAVVVKGSTGWILTMLAVIPVFLAVVVRITLGRSNDPD